MSSVLADAVATALGSVGAALPELQRTLTVDGTSATVIVTSSVDHTEDAASSSGPNEAFRIVAQVSDFPDLSLASLVELDGDAHLITSLRATGGAAWFAGLSKTLEDTVVAYVGTRRGGDGVRSISTSLRALITEGEADYTATDMVAYDPLRTWSVVISREEWPEATEPRVGDSLVYSEQRLAVARVSPHTGYFLITARARS